MNVLIQLGDCRFDFFTHRSYLLKSPNKLDFLTFILRLFLFYPKTTVKSTFNCLSICVSSHNKTNIWVLICYLKLNHQEHFLFDWLIWLWTYLASRVNVNVSSFTSRKSVAGWMETPKLGRTDQKLIYVICHDVKKFVSS